MKEKIRILLVEDDKDDAELLTNALDENSVEYELTLVGQGDKALKFLYECKTLPDILLLDLNLPKLHGKEILLKLKNNARFAELPVVVLSTSSSADDLNFCLANGAKSFIVKPTTLNGFNTAVSTIIKNIGTKN